MENELRDRDNITGKTDKYPIQAATTPPRPVTYRFMAELDKACNEFFKKRGIKWPQ